MQIQLHTFNRNLRLFPCFMNKQRVWCVLLKGIFLFISFYVFIYYLLHYMHRYTHIIRFPFPPPTRSTHTLSFIQALYQESFPFLLSPSALIASRERSTAVPAKILFLVLIPHHHFSTQFLWWALLNTWYLLHTTISYHTISP